MEKETWSTVIQHEPIREADEMLSSTCSHSEQRLLYWFIVFMAPPSPMGSNQKDLIQSSQKSFLCARFSVFVNVKKSF